MTDAPETIVEAKPISEKQAAIQSWNDADTIEGKILAVKKFPVLVEFYALAANLITK